MIISETQIFGIMARQNSWWQTGYIPSHLAHPFKKLAFYEILNFLSYPDLNRAIILTGARRVGKTTLLHQIAAKNLKEGTRAKKIIYLNFEDFTLSQNDLPKILNLYEKNIGTIDHDNLLLLDEIHYIPNWTRWLMSFLREYPRTRIVATGSAAVLLKNSKRTESAAGRWTSIHVPTLTFYEYLSLKGIAPPELPNDFDLYTLTKLSPQKKTDLMLQCAPLQSEFNNYLLQGGFPAFVSGNFPLNMIQNFIREDIIDKTLKQDMALLYNARSLHHLEKIFAYLCFNLGGILEKNTLARELGVSPITVENHLQRLEDTHLIYRLNPFNQKGKKSLKPRAKFYIADPSLRNAVLLKGEGIFEDPNELGPLVEACVLKHLHTFYHSQGAWAGYWRKNREIDFVFTLPNNTIHAYEVKYQENPEGKIIESYEEFFKYTPKVSHAFAITKNVSNYGIIKETNIFKIPAFLFCYLLGFIENNKLKK